MALKYAGMIRANRYRSSFCYFLRTLPVSAAVCLYFDQFSQRLSCDATTLLWRHASLYGAYSKYAGLFYTNAKFDGLIDMARKR